MKIAKIIYFSALPVFLALILLFSFIHVFDGGSKGRASDQFLATAKRHAATIYEESKKGLDEVVLNQNDSEYAFRAIDKILGSSGLSIRTANSTSDASIPVYDDETDELLYSIPRVSYNKDSSKIVTNRFSAEYLVSIDKQIEYQKNFGDSANLEIAVDRYVKNTIVVVPGQKTKNGESADAILLTIHMDSPKSMASAVDAASMGVALAQLTELYNYENSTSNPDKNAKYENDIIFLFTDARYDNSFGVAAFFDSFVGFYQTASSGNFTNLAVEDIVSRIKLAVNFDSIGTSGASMLLQTSSNNTVLVREFASMMGGAVSSSFVSSLYDGYASDFNAFGDLNALNLVTFGNKANYGLAKDSIEQTPDSVYAKKADMLIGSVSHFGNMDLSKLDSNSDSIYFSFLGIGTISYPIYASYIFGAIILLLMGGIIALNIIKKRFSFKAVLRASIIQILSLLATVGSMFLLYFLVSSILAGFGLFTIQSLTSYVYANAGIITGYALFATVILSLFYALIRKSFKSDKPISAMGLVRGGVAIFAVVSAILCFACPMLAYMFAIPSIMFLLAMLSTMLITKYDLSKLFIYLIPFAISLAFIVPTVVLIALSVRSVLMPIIILPLMMLLLTTAPYVLMLVKPLNALAKRLPMRTIRVQKTVVERIENKAKPDKSTQREVKKIVKEKINWRYRHGAGVAAVATIAAVLIMSFSAFSMPFGANAFVDYAQKQPFNQYVSSIYDNSLVLNWSSTGVSVEEASVSLQVHDKAAYKYFKEALNGYSWNSSENAYTKSLSTNMMPSPAVSTQNNLLSISPAKFPGKGVVEISLLDISSVSAISIFDGDVFKKKINVSNVDTLDLRFSLDESTYSTIGLEFEFKSLATSISFELNQYIWDYLSASHLINESININESTIKEDIRALVDHFKGNSEVLGAMRFGVVYNLNKTIEF